MSKTKDIYLNENGDLILKSDMLKVLHLQERKVECIIDSEQIILRNPLSFVERLFGCCGEEKIEDYDFH